MKKGVPEAPNLEATRGVVADRILQAEAMASAALTKAGIPHFVVGGLAVGAWGHPRATPTVDSGAVLPIEALFGLKLRVHRRQDIADLAALIDAGAELRAIEEWLVGNGFIPELARLRALKELPEMHPASVLADSAAELINMLAIVAAPKIREQWLKSAKATLKQSVFECLRDFDESAEVLRLGSAGQTGAEPLLRLRSASKELAVLAATATASLDDEACISKARECLVACGIPEPPEGWDSFEGYQS